MALNDLGWILVALLLTHRMSGATIGLFAYLLSNQVIVKTSIKADFLVAAVISGVGMRVMSKLVSRKCC